LIIKTSCLTSLYFIWIKWWFLFKNIHIILQLIIIIRTYFIGSMQISPNIDYSIVVERIWYMTIQSKLFSWYRQEHSSKA
jgi:hypothetical protein